MVLVRVVCSWVFAAAAGELCFGGGGAENGTNPVDGLLVWVGSDSTGWVDLVVIWMIGMHRCLNIGFCSLQASQKFFFQRTYLDKLNPYEYMD